MDIKQLAELEDQMGKAFYVDVLRLEDRVNELETALRKIAELRYAEDTSEPFDEALDIADAILLNINPLTPHP